MLIRVAAPAESKLIAPPVALLGNPAEIFHGHIGLFHQHPALIASDTGLRAKSGLPVDAVAHNANVNQMRKGRHQWIDAGIAPVFIQYSGSDVSASFRIKGRSKLILGIVDDIPHSNYPYDI